MQVLCVAHRKDLLGEGPVWDARNKCLYWVDIKRSLLEWLRPGSNEFGEFQLGCRASALALRQGGGLLLCTDKGFAVFEPATQQLELVVHPEPDRTSNRPNDGHTDSMGRFWLGTMDDSGKTRTGAIYRLDTDWKVTKLLDGFGIPNTVAFSPDGNTLYLADSMDRTLFAYEVQPSSGMLGARRVFAHMEESAGTPDGSALDEEGCLWNAQWGAGRIVRYRPDGSIDTIVPMPVSQPTSCAFGGENLETLFVTSARTGIPEHILDTQPLAGSVFSFSPGVRGLKLSPFGA
jgi:sugar lactone lactonase YvrE